MTFLGFYARPVLCQTGSMSNRASWLTTNVSQRMACNEKRGLSGRVRFVIEPRKYRLTLHGFEELRIRLRILQLIQQKFDCGKLIHGMKYFS